MAKETTNKRKRDSAVEQNPTVTTDTSKPTAVFKPSSGRSYTVSVALPGSIIANAQTHDLKTTLAGHLARALAVFCVDEIVIFSDNDKTKTIQHNQYSNDPRKQHLAAQDEENGYTAFSDPDNFLFHVLSYLETPPYLRRALFGWHPNLRTAGALPSVDMPHHLRAEEWCQYREGVTVDESGFQGPNGTAATKIAATAPSSKKPKQKNTSQQATLVNAGFSSLVSVPASIPPNTRVTLQFDSTSAPTTLENLTASAVSPDAPREEGGYYWGYTPRLASSLSAVFTECPYEGGYDYSIGTSERGISLPAFLGRTGKADSTVHDDIEVAGDGQAAVPSLPKWSHLVIVFGGLAGLEKALLADAELKGKVAEASQLFDAWINLVEGQGSRTIRTEEAVWIGLMGLKEVIVANGEK